MNLVVVDVQVSSQHGSERLGIAMTKERVS